MSCERSRDNELQWCNIFTKDSLRRTPQWYHHLLNNPSGERLYILRRGLLLEGYGFTVNKFLQRIFLV